MLYEKSRGRRKNIILINMQKKITFDSFIRGILTTIIIVGILYIIDILSSVLLPFFIAWLIAYMMYPCVNFVQHKLRFKNRVLSIIAVFIFIIAAITGLSYLIVPSIVDEFYRFKDLIASYISEGNKQSAIPAGIEKFITEHINMEYILNALNGENFSETIKEIAPKVWMILSESFSIVMGIVSIFFIIIYTFFILLDYEEISEGWVSLVPSKYRDKTVEVVNDIKNGMNRYFRGQAIVAFCVGILFCIGFLIIDFPLAIGLGLFIGLLNMVPYLQLLGFLPVTVLAILKAADTGESFWIIMLGVIVVFCVVQIIQDVIIVPKVMGKITGLNPAIILLSLSVWGSLMGIVGMIIALPCTSLMLSYYQRYIKRKEEEYSNDQPSEN